MRKRSLWAASVALSSAVAAAAACSFIVDFNPEGQPCGPKDTCLEGYRCSGGKCTSKTLDAGSFCETCAPRKPCYEEHRICDPTCADLVCPVGQACADTADGPTCFPIPLGKLGHACLKDTDCQGGTNAFCLSSGILDSAGDGGVPRGGFCTQKCGSTPPDAGELCASLASVVTRGGLVSLVLKAAGVDHPRPVPCVKDSDCADYQMLCVPFDSLQVDPVGGADGGQGPLGFCDLPATGGVKAGLGCNKTSDLCNHGLCLPSAAGPSWPPVKTVCSQLCSGDQDCFAGGHCTSAEVKTADADGGFRFRVVKSCILDRPSACAPCTKVVATSDGGTVGTADPSLCAADAPNCAQSIASTDGGFSCLYHCAQHQDCPPGWGCQSSPVGTVCMSPTCGG